MLGLFDKYVPSFVKQYAQLAGTIDVAVRDYVSDVRSGAFPAPRVRTDTATRA